jgi:hypothetical protein
MGSASSEFESLVTYMERYRRGSFAVHREVPEHPHITYMHRSAKVDVSVEHPDGAWPFVRIRAHVLRGLHMDMPLAVNLLKRNAVAYHGAFALVDDGDAEAQLVFIDTLAAFDLSDEVLKHHLYYVELQADTWDDELRVMHGGDRGIDEVH